MLRKRNEYPLLYTPKGDVAWSSIAEADYEYKPDEGEFHIRVRFDPEDPGLDPLREAAEEILQEAYADMKARLKKEKKGALLNKLHLKEDVIPEEIDRESGQPTGKVVIRAGMKHKVTPKTGKNAGKTFTFKPDVFDAKTNRLKSPPQIGRGSEVKVALRPMEYFMPKDGEMGISWKLEAVQIIRLVQGGSRDAASYGFGEEEGDTLRDTGGFDDEGDGYEAEDDDTDF